MKHETAGDRIRATRLGLGLSQRDLAEPGVSHAYISRIEAGTRTASVRALRMLAGKLGVTPEYLEFGIDITTTDSLVRDLTERSGERSVTLSVETNGVHVAYDGQEAFGRTLSEALVNAIRVEKRKGALRAERARLERETARVDAELSEAV